MSIAHTSGKLIAYGLLIASLAQPFAVFAAEPDKSNGELAPGFNICEKRAADSAKTSAEYKERLLSCLDSAEKYWEGLLTNGNIDYLNAYKETYRYDDMQQAIPDFHKAWLKYKETGSDLFKSDDDHQNIRSRYFEVQETKRQAKLLTMTGGLLYSDTQEEEAPGFNICIERALRPGKTRDEYRDAKDDCEELATVYWTTILKNNYEIHMNLYKDSPEKQKKLQNFQRAWEQYVDAGHNVILNEGGSASFDRAACFIFKIKESRRQARLLDGTGLRW